MSGDDSICQSFLATAPARRGERLAAALIILVSCLGFSFAAPFAGVHLPKVPAFIAGYESSLVVIDLITATLLLCQFRELRLRSLLVLAAGYLFDAFVIVPHALSFPGVYAVEGLLGTSHQTTPWLYIAWHALFPLFIIAYALAVRSRWDAPIAAERAAPAIAVAIGGAALLASACTLLATWGLDLLPAMVDGDNHRHVTTSGFAPLAWLMSLAALVVLVLRTRGRTILDLWLAVVMVAWLLDVLTSTLLSTMRYDFGWYAGRVYGLLAASVVLGAFLLETNELYRRLARALMKAGDRAKELAMSQEQLHQAQKMEAVGQLTGGIAHDFNNLLTAVIGNLDLLLRSGAASGRQRAYIDAAHQAAQRGAVLTQQLLAFGRRQTLRPETVNVNALLQGFAALLRRAVGESVTLALSPDPYLWPCDLDAAQFEAAILNLTLNARDAMPGGGALTIETRRVERTAEEVDPADFWPAGHYVAVAVSDTGTGMSPHVRAHAFEPFFTTKDAGRGSGLGLSQVYGFVKQMGGHVAITSEEGKGTTVTLFLPRAETGAASEPRAKPAAPVDGAGETVLVVEDDALVRQSVVAMLAASGYRVLTASDGREALQILESVERVDLLFSDVVMPQGMSGVDVARAAQRLRGGIKVLLTSGYAAEVLAARGANGNFPIVAKPYGHSELAERVRLALADGREVA